ncbi:hypothetical protein BIFDEN_01228 [Bifidobacterium dentium ATCC 27678]|nr:hypothetical protein BIFDEN_01228 [Bifidobacterium dentium ATCC 27678]
MYRPSATAWKLQAALSCSFSNFFPVMMLGIVKLLCFARENIAGSGKSTTLSTRYFKDKSIWQRCQRREDDSSLQRRLCYEIPLKTAHC